MDTKNREKGASAVEFALILPLLLFVLFAIIEYSIVMYDKAVLTNATREGARRGILMGSPRPSTGEIIDTVNAYCAGNLISLGAPAAPAVSVPAPCTASGEYISVAASYPYTFLLVPNFMNRLTGQIILSAVSAMRCE